MRKRTAFSLVLFAAVCAASLAWASEGHEVRFEAGKFIAGIVNFAIFLYILIRFGGKGIAGYFKNRAETQMAAVREAEGILAEAKGLFAEVTKRKDRLEAETEQIIQGARRRAEQQAEEILASARKTADRLVEDAERTIANELAEAQAMLRDRLVEQALEIARGTVRERMNEEGQRRSIENFVSKMEEFS